MAQTDILLEAGTNELEVLVFNLGQLRCGVNVAKVREVTGSFDLVRVPRAHPAMIGVMNLRDSVIPLVDLQLYLHGAPCEAKHRHLIVMEFNNLVMGFVVDGVEQIYRLPWKAVAPLPANQQAHAAVTSVCHVEDKLVLMVDFEKIAFDIHGLQVAAASELKDTRAGFNRADYRILIAEDSSMMRAFLESTMRTAGYEQLTVVADGAEAWNRISKTVDSDARPFDLIVSDIEMPQMDGLHLTRRIKEHPQLKDTPVVIFSSLVSNDNAKKTSQVGADCTLTKPQLARLVEIADEFLQRAATVGV